MAKVIAKHPEAFDPFEGQAVVAAGVEISNAAGGFQKALDVEPQSWQHGDHVLLLVRVDVTKIRFDPIAEDEDELRRIHVMRATDVTSIDPEVARELNLTQMLNEASDRVRVKREEAQGVKRMFDGEGNPVEPDEWSDEPLEGQVSL